MKRAFDLCLSSIGLIFSAPLWIAIPIAIRLEDGGPIFFSQARVGLNGRVFQALKFRSMIPDAEALSGPVQANEGDLRITRVGGDAPDTASCQPPSQRRQGLGGPLSQTYIVHSNPRGSSEKSPWSLPARGPIPRLMGKLRAKR